MIKGRRKSLKWMTIGGALGVAIFLVGPTVIRMAYCLTTRRSEIESMKRRYRDLETSEGSLPVTERPVSSRRR